MLFTGYPLKNSPASSIGYAADRAIFIDNQKRGIVPECPIFYLKFNNPLFHNLMGKKLVISFNRIGKIKVVRDKIFYI